MEKSETDSSLIDADGKPFHIKGVKRDPRETASDPNQSLKIRLEAFEDIIDSEVGDTMFLRARNMEREAGFRQIFFKFEGDNPNGTQKDRIAFAQCMDALRRGFDAIALAARDSCGEVVASAAFAAGLRCVIYVPKKERVKRVGQMKALGAEIVPVEGGCEETRRISSAVAAEKEYCNANPGDENTALQMMVYGRIAYEIYDDLHDAPAVVAVPVFSGTTLAGVYRGFSSLYRRGKTSRIPRMAAGFGSSENPLFRELLKVCQKTGFSHMEETGAMQGEKPEIGPDAFAKTVFPDVVRCSRGWAVSASIKDMRRYAKLIREKEGLRVRPDSAAALIALLEGHRRESFPDGRYVAILTGGKDLF